jgi:DnaJ-domain-containing protein 1
LLELQGINAFDEKDTQMDVDFLMSQIELRELLEAIKTTKDEMAFFIIVHPLIDLPVCLIAYKTSIL